MGRVPYLLVLSLVALPSRTTQVKPSHAACQFNIVSSTVVVAHCAHREGDHEVMDVVIAWRGQPGWFQRRDGFTGGRGSSDFGAGRRVSQSATYGGVTIGFAADFEAGTVALEGQTIILKGVNTILIDEVERADARPMSPPFWIEPHLPLSADVNLALAKKSRALRSFLRCDVPMPTAPRGIPQPPVVTVCEKLAASPLRAPNGDAHSLTFP